MVVVTCVKVGTKYGSEYVNRLAAGVARQATRPYRFLCLTDDPSGVQCETAPIGTDLPGWWAKLVLFQPHPALAGERVLYFDLDTVLVGNIDALLDYTGEAAFLSDFYHPSELASGVIGLAPGAWPAVWSAFDQAMIPHYWGDQAWIETHVPQADRWQDLLPGQVVSYKVDVVPHGLNGARVVCYH